MERIEFEIPDSCEIMFMGDTHGGSIFTHYHGIQDAINYVKTHKFCYWEHGGDWIEAIACDDKRFQSDTVKEPIPMKQAREMVAMYKPIAKKGIVGLSGNHESKLDRFGNLAEDICKQLKIPYGTSEARIIFVDKNGDRRFGIFVTHKVPSFNSNAKDFVQAEANVKAAMKNALVKRAIGDCAAMICHHAHQLIIVEPAARLFLVDGKHGLQQNYLTGDMGAEGQYIDPDRRYYCCAGSFRKRFKDGYDDYSDIYSPNELGALIMTVKDGAIAGFRKFKV